MRSLGRIPQKQKHFRFSRLLYLSFSLLPLVLFLSVCLFFLSASLRCLSPLLSPLFLAPPPNPSLSLSLCFFPCTVLNSPRQDHPCQISVSATAIVSFAQLTGERKKIVACVRMLNSANFAGMSLTMSLRAWVSLGIATGISVDVSSIFLRTFPS